MIYSIGAIIICLVAKWGKLIHFQNLIYLTFDLEWLESYNTTLYGFSRVPSPKSGTVYRHVNHNKDIVIPSRALHSKSFKFIAFQIKNNVQYNTNWKE